MSLLKAIRRSSNSEWYEYYHVHPSLYGETKRNLVWMISFEQRIGKLLRARKKHHQRWIFIDMQNWEYDAIFIHSKNPNRDNFPRTFSPGRISAKHRFEYEKILKYFSKRGYKAFKGKGVSAIYALPLDK